MRDVASDLLNQVRRQILLADCARIVDDTLVQCIDRLHQFHEEFRNELKNRPRSLIKCSYWTQWHLEYTDARFSGLNGEGLRNRQCASLVRKLLRILTRLVSETNQILGVRVYTLAEDKDVLTPDICKSRMQRAARLAKQTRRQLTRLQHEAARLRRQADGAADKLSQLLVGDRFPNRRKPR